MAWKIEASDTAKRTLRKLDSQASKRILDFRDERIALSEDPRSLGQALSGPLRRHWRYHVGDHRVICDLQDNRLVVLVLEIGNRRDIYR